MRVRYAAPTAGLALILAAAALAGCGGSDSDDPTPTPSSSAPEPTEPATSEATTAPTSSGGTADAPEVLEASVEPLDWRPVAGSVDVATTTNGTWFLRVSKDSSTWTLDRGRASGSGSSVNGWRVSDALLDDDWAVVVLQDETEQKPSRAIVTHLDDRDTFTIDGGSDVPTTNGGTWALGEDRLVHATVSDGSYCVATVDLETRSSTLGWCAPKRHGFNAAHVTDAGTSVLSFDDSRPSCRTVMSVDGTEATPFPGVVDCTAWEGVRTDDGAAWSVIENERRIDEAHLYARVGDGYFDLGPGTSGTLTWCDEAAYFVRDPQRQGDPAALMRWSAEDGLTVAYESRRGQAFLEDPRCGGDAITITARTSAGDEQVTATL